LTEKPIDTAVAKELQDTMGAEFTKELVDTFLREGPAMLSDLRRSAAGGDGEAFRRAAHSIKSNAATFGAMRLADLARGLELGGREAGSISALEAEFARAAEALRDLLDG
jgi:HPt (histidine-containing phosphotransfer) domain-containing protein